MTKWNPRRSIHKGERHRLDQIWWQNSWHVAKTPQTASSEALWHEARILLRLQGSVGHGLPGSHGIHRIGARDRLVLDHAGGPSLDKLEGTITARQAAMSCSALFGTLGWVHEAGIIHGNVCPSNVIALPGNLIELCDFSCAALLIDGRARNYGRQQSLEYGRSGSRMLLSKADDVYSAAAVCWYLCGTFLAQGEDLGPIFKILHSIVNPTGARPDSAWDLVCELLEVVEEEDDRQPSSDNLAQVIELESAPPSSR